ncbi:GDP-L-fucose synthase [Herbaspirillum seropedicae]|uniref:GDP-L-fucose synthase family protein n=1 Tax=Herbaspirillum seropedicae TaxID=964 RepID=UPI00112226F2|nr:GDP-L-fucose synthase [Herbaspirillum seropedicae]QDD66438.1 GDP-L-fucose synthase [Herbaspirillum seropedicae]
MAKARILLTGGRGMVGRNILEHPLADQWDFIAPGSHELDLTDFAATQRFMKEVKPDVVIHSAGRVGGIQANMAHPVDFLVTNVDLGRNVVLAAREAGVSKLLNLASSCMYPRNAVNPLHEDLILKGELEPTNEGYALAKIFATRLCQYVSRENPNLQYKTLIPCNLYGRHDKFSPAHSHLIPAIIHKVHQAKLHGLASVEIWGDGLARREFMYTGDLADAVLRGLARFEQLPDLMNIGLGHDFSINDYYTATAEVIGWEGNFMHDTTKPVGMKQKLVDIERQRTWGWMPATSLREGIQKAYQYYLQEGTHEL